MGRQDNAMIIFAWYTVNGIDQNLFAGDISDGRLLCPAFCSCITDIEFGPCGIWKDRD